MGFKDVARKFDPDDATTLQLWATANDRDEIKRLCGKSSVPFALQFFLLIQ
jgi:hypothetical protein